MDIDLLKTFLEVNKTRHFGRAADNLFITPAAVSARIRQLEASFGVQLFLRQRNNLRLSLEGERLVAHAENLLLAWGRLRQEVGAAKELTNEFSLGASEEVWTHILQPGMPSLLKQLPEMRWRAIAQSQSALVEQLLAQSLDVALLSEPSGHQELESVRIGHLRLLLLSSIAAVTLKQALQGSYVWMDWGAPFELFHVRKFGEQSLPVLRTNISGVALSYLQQCSASAYLPQTLLQSVNTTLHRVKGAPGFHWPVYAVYRASHPREALLRSVLPLLISSTRLVQDEDQDQISSSSISSKS